MDPIEQLDKVLSYLNHNIPKKEKRSEIIERLNFEITEKDLLLVIEKLCKDGYVNYIHLENIDSNTGERKKGAKIYCITFEGRVFIENVGYTKELKNNKIKLLNQKLVNFSLIFGGVAAGCYYSLELVKIICKIFFH